MLVAHAFAPPSCVRKILELDMHDNVDITADPFTDILPAEAFKGITSPLSLTTESETVNRPS
jgi:hypothetical protein